MCSESGYSSMQINSFLAATKSVATAFYYSIHFPQINFKNLKINPTKGEL